MPISKPDTAWPTRHRHHFDTTAQWVTFAAGMGVPDDFLRGPWAQAQSQPVDALVEHGKDHVAAVGVFFRTSRECGLWVHPQNRSQGLGRAMWRDLIAYHAGAPLYASVSQGAHTAAHMLSLLRETGFSQVARRSPFTIWRR